jgi:hypothetical protein
VVSVTDPYGRIPGFLSRNRYLFFQVARQIQYVYAVIVNIVSKVYSVSHTPKITRGFKYY